MLDAHLGPDLAGVRGETDSERVLALIARESRTRGGDLGGSIVAALEWVGENLPVFALNLVIATWDELWAVRYPTTHELWILQRPVDARGILEHCSATGTRVRSHHLARLPSVVVASEPMDDDPAWRLLDPGTISRVDPRLHVHTVATLPSPRHLLTLADLAPDAALSQARPWPGTGTLRVAPEEWEQQVGALDQELGRLGGNRPARVVPCAPSSHRDPGPGRRSQCGASRGPLPARAALDRHGCDRLGH